MDNALRAAGEQSSSARRQWVGVATLPVLGLLAAWVLSMILLPVGRWTLGEAAIVPGVSLSAVLQASAVLVILTGAWGLRRTALTATVVVVAAWALEFVGSHTGVPFGAYSYTDRLQPQLGAVPLLVPFAWLMMLPPAWAVGARVSGRTSGLAFIAASALAFTVWDLFLDPQMVGWHFWTWQTPVGYFGIPWVNFAGWFVGAALITTLVRPSRLPLRPLLLIYAVTWGLESIGQMFFWSLPGPAVAGFVGMGRAAAGGRASAGADGMTAMVYTVVGFFSGSLMFSLWLGKLALHKDVRRYGDGNPGAFNMILAGGVVWGVLALMLDVIKGAIPVLLARYVGGVTGPALIPVVLAPVFGHAFSPFLGFHGGKAVAVTFGVWAGLTLWEAPSVLGIWLGVWFVLLAVSGWAVVLMMLGLLAYLLLVTPSPVLLAIWVVNAALLAWKYRVDLRLFPEPRPWLKARLRWSR